MNYLDIENWVRKEHYYFFKQMDYPHFNVCANIDISNLLAYVKRNNYSFYHTFIYLASRVANSIPEFRYRMQGDKIAVYESVHPSFTVLKGTDAFRYCTVRYESDIFKFYHLVEKRLEDLNRKQDLDDAAGRDDLLYMTSIPWVSFTSITHPVHMHPADSIPRISWGKYFDDNGMIKMPLSVQANHAIMDGYHIGRYFNELQELIHSPGIYYKHDV